jgi:branched-chain amino acid transport system permease protein
LQGKQQYNIFALTAIILLFLVPIVFRDNSYLLLLFCTIGISVIAVSGLDILYGYSGQISFGHAAFYAIGAYTSTILSKTVGMPVWVTLIIGAFFAAIMGVIIAFPAAKLVHHFLALLTIAFGQIVYIIISNATSLTNGFTGINCIPAPRIGSYVLKGNFNYFYIIIVFTIIFLFVKQKIIKSRIGRAFIAIRENTHAANGMGINVMYYKIMAFAISAFYTGFAGGLYAHFIGFISPETFVYSQSVLFITMLLFGGTGSLVGPIIGVAILSILTEGLQSIGSYQTLIYGILLLVGILFLPKGIYGFGEIIGDYFKEVRKRDVKNVEA